MREDWLGERKVMGILEGETEREQLRMRGRDPRRTCGWGPKGKDDDGVIRVQWVWDRGVSHTCRYGGQYLGEGGRPQKEGFRNLERWAD